MGYKAITMAEALDALMESGRLVPTMRMQLENFMAQARLSIPGLPDPIVEDAPGGSGALMSWIDNERFVEVASRVPGYLDYYKLIYEHNKPVYERRIASLSIPLGVLYALRHFARKDRNGPEDMSY
jgi:hypothetical protein